MGRRPPPFRRSAPRALARGLLLLAAAAAARRSGGAAAAAFPAPPLPVPLPAAAAAFARPGRRPTPRGRSAAAAGAPGRRRRPGPLPFLRAAAGVGVAGGDEAAADGNGDARKRQHFRRLASSYPPGTPPGLRGEAVRSALRSDRGVCVDFTSRKHALGERLNVGCVRVEGVGTVDFLNNKLTNTFRAAEAGSGTTGRVAEACLLTPRGRTVDRLTVPTLPSSAEGGRTDGFLITSPGNAGSALFDRLDPLIFPLDGVTLTDMCPGGGMVGDDDDNGNGGGATKDGRKTRVLTLAAAQARNAQDQIRKFVLPLLGKAIAAEFSFPLPGSCARFTDLAQSLEVLILPSTFLPGCVAAGYTLIVTENEDGAVADRAWDTLVDEDNLEGPVEIGPAEYESLRIEGGLAGYGCEMTGDAAGSSTDDDAESDTAAAAAVGTKASPLELRLDSIVDVDKGCYLGQEGVAALLKNKRGVPRTLYSVVFRDDQNEFEDDGGTAAGMGLGLEQDQEEEEEDDDDDDDWMISLDDLLTSGGDGSGGEREENLTRPPRPGDVLYALGSNERIKVGTLTSVAERGSTGEPTTVALALVRRSESILKRMGEMGLRVGWDDPFAEDPLWADGGRANPTTLDARSVVNEEGGSGVIPPPLLDSDPLEGLEVIVGGTYTVGTLRAVPSEKFAEGVNMFDAEVEAFFGRRRGKGGAATGDARGIDDGPGEATVREAERWRRKNGPDGAGGGEAMEWDESAVPAGWEEAAADSSTEEAAATSATDDDDGKENAGEDDEGKLRRAEEEAARAAAEAEAAAAEAKRKAEKMEALKRRAEEAMERRRAKKEEAVAEKEREKVKAEEEKDDEAAARRAAETEERRKAEKMEMLQRRAEEAVARRKAKKANQ